MKRFYQIFKKTFFVIVATLFVLSGVRAWAVQPIADIQTDTARGGQTLEAVKATGNIPLEIVPAASLNPDRSDTDSAWEQVSTVQPAGASQGNQPATTTVDATQAAGLQAGQLQGPCEQIASLFLPMEGQLTSCQPLASGFSYDVKIAMPRSDATLTVDRTNNMILNSHTISQQSAGSSVDKAVQYDVTGGVNHVQETTSVDGLRATKLTFIDMVANGPIAASCYILDKESGNLYGGMETEAFTTTDPVIITSINHNLQVKTLATQAQTELAKLDIAIPANDPDLLIGVSDEVDEALDRQDTQMNESYPALLAVAGNPQTGNSILNDIAREINVQRFDCNKIGYEDHRDQVAAIYSAIVNNPQSDKSTLNTIADSISIRSTELADVAMAIFNDPRADSEIRGKLADKVLQEWGCTSFSNCDNSPRATQMDYAMQMINSPLSDGEVIDKIASDFIADAGEAQGTGEWGPAYNPYGEQLTQLINDNPKTKPETLDKLGDMVITQYLVYRECEVNGQSYLQELPALDNLLTVIKENTKTPSETRIKIDAFYADYGDRIKSDSDLFETSSPRWVGASQ